MINYTNYRHRVGASNGAFEAFSEREMIKLLGKFPKKFRNRKKMMRRGQLRGRLVHHKALKFRKLARLLRLNHT